MSPDLLRDMAKYWTCLIFCHFSLPLTSSTLLWSKSFPQTSKQSKSKTLNYGKSPPQVPLCHVTYQSGRSVVSSSMVVGVLAGVSGGCGEGWWTGLLVTWNSGHQYWVGYGYPHSHAPALVPQSQSRWVRPLVMK